MSNVILAYNLKTLRQQNGLTQQELAKAAGMAHQNISAWESGKRSPRGQSLQKIADALGVTVEHLLTDRTEHEQTIEDNSDKLFKPAGLPVDFSFRYYGPDFPLSHIYNGSTVYGIYTGRAVNDGDILALRIDGALTLRRVHVLPAKLGLMLRYDTTTDGALLLERPIPSDSQVEVLGRVVMALVEV